MRPEIRTPAYCSEAIQEGLPRIKRFVSAPARHCAALSTPIERELFRSVYIIGVRQEVA